MTFALKDIHTVYADLRLKARRLLAGEREGHTLQPTALLNEYLSNLFSSESWEAMAWENRDHFFKVATASMRNELISYARRRGAAKRPDGKRRVDIEDIMLLTDERIEEVVALEELLDQLEKAPELKSGPTIAQAVRLHIYGGFTQREMAEWLRLSEERTQYLLDFGLSWIARHSST